MFATKKKPLFSALLMKLLSVMDVIDESTMPISSLVNILDSLFFNQVSRNPLCVTSVR